MTPAPRIAPNKRIVPFRVPSGEGLISRSGHIALAPQYASVKLLAFADAIGRPVDVPRWFSVGQERGLRTRYALFDVSGKKHTEFLYDEITAAEDVLLCTGRNRSAVYDAHNGALLFEPPYRSLHASEGIIWAGRPMSNNEKAMALFTRTGRKFRLDRNWHSPSPIEFHSGLALVFDGANASYMDKNGRLALHNIFFFLGNGNFGDVYSFSPQGFAAGRVRGKTISRFGIVDKRGEFAFPAESPRIRQFIDGRFAVMREKEKLFALYAPNVQSLSEFIYSDVQQEDYGFLSAEHEGNWKFIDSLGKPLPLPDDVPPDAKIDPISRNLLRVQIARPSGTQCGTIDLQGNWSLEPGSYEDVRLLCVQQRKPIYLATLSGENAKVMMIDSTGNALTPAVDQLSYLEDELCQLWQDENISLIDLKGSPVWKARPQDMLPPPIPEYVPEEEEPAPRPLPASSLARQASSGGKPPQSHPQRGGGNDGNGGNGGNRAGGRPRSGPGKPNGTRGPGVNSAPGQGGNGPAGNAPGGKTLTQSAAKPASGNPSVSKTPPAKTNAVRNPVAARNNAAKSGAPRTTPPVAPNRPPQPPRNSAPRSSAPGIAAPKDGVARDNAARANAPREGAGGDPAQRSRRPRSQRIVTRPQKLE